MSSEPPTEEQKKKSTPSAGVSILVLLLFLFQCCALWNLFTYSTGTHRDTEVDVFLQKPNWDSLVLIGAAVLGANFLAIFGLVLTTPVTRARRNRFNFVMTVLFMSVITAYVVWYVTRPKWNKIEVTKSQSWVPKKIIQARQPEPTMQNPTAPAVPSVPQAVHSTPLDFVLPKLSGLYRVDGRNEKVDQETRAVTPANMRMVAWFGTEDQLGDVLRGVTPRLDRTICVYTYPHMDGKTISQSEFDEYKQSVVADEVKLSDETKERMSQGEKDTNAYLQSKLGSGNELKIADMESLGVFDSTESSIAYAAFAKTNLESSGKINSSTVLASAISAVRLPSGKFITITAQVVYSKPEDMKWAKNKVIEARDALLLANPKP